MNDLNWHNWFVTANNVAGEMQWQNAAFSSSELVDLIDEALEEKLIPSVEFLERSNVLPA